MVRYTEDKIYPISDIVRDANGRLISLCRTLTDETIPFKQKLTIYRDSNGKFNGCSEWTKI